MYAKYLWTVHSKKSFCFYFYFAKKRARKDQSWQQKWILLIFRAKDLVVENETLLNKIEKFYDISKVDLDKHLFLKENAEIVLAENEALKEKINNLRDQHSIDQQEYSKRIRECKREFMNARNQADDLKQVLW